MIYIIGAIVILIVYLWTLYNSLITSKLRISEAFSQIDVQLKRRANLIPNLIETVKGYAKHEKQLLEEITKARTNLMSAKGIEEKAQANNQLSNTLKSLFAVAENYPNLKASENFLELQQELSDTEDKIAYSRQFYNSNVLDYNTKIKVFPNVILVGFFNFRESEFFAANEKERESIKVSF